MRPINCTTACCAGLITIALGAVGCSSGTPSTGSRLSGATAATATNTATTTGSGGTGAAMPGPQAPKSTVPDAPIVLTDGGQAPQDDTQCASTDTPTTIIKVGLAFVFDVSASMGSGQRPSDSKELKWDPVVAATKAFFIDPYSEGVSATLTFFPNELATLTGNQAGGMLGGGPECDAAGYTDPDVPLTPLPSDAFGLAIDAVTPPDQNSWRLGTPTLPAIQGTIQAIDTMRAADPNMRFSIVLVTDGVPALCFGGLNDSVTDVANAVQAVAADTPTYVIGVQSPDDNSLDSLNQVAEAGGTGMAFLVDTANPAQTSTDFKAAIDTIRENSFSCTTEIPPAPAGETFDQNKVNVKFTSASGAEVDYAYDPTCAGENSWRYDDEVNPTSIEVCPTVCDSIKNSLEDGQLSIEFGCETRIR